ncbi:MAG: 3-deoxy-7-phosphoheptulonate synthase [Bdellovibrionales bacterium]|nr:3-deoxy-7-phosphoheptulonate synthase [Bdellovibrionales bacterium]
MIIILKKGCSEADAQPILERIESLGLKPLYLPGDEKIVLGAIGDERILAQARLESLPVVERIVPILKPHRLSNLEFQPERSRIQVGEVVFGGEEIPVIAGPCAVESERQIVETAQAVRAAGARLLRAGAYKPRTSPYAFQGLEEEGLRLLAIARDASGLPIVTEVISEHDVEKVGAVADMFQIGARNMQNFRLLKAVGGTKTPVLLKRGPAASMGELLLAAEYILAEGNPNVVLCERGIKSFFADTRNTFDLSVIPLLKQETHLPVIADPSHGTGVRSIIPAMSLAAIACGADGLLIEVHPSPQEALSDGFQQLTPEQFQDLMIRSRSVARAVGRTISEV